MRTPVFRLLMTAAALPLLGAAAGSPPGSWSSLPDTPREHRYHGLAARGDRLYSLGGDGAAPVEEFDPGTGTWTTLGSAPAERSFSGTAALGHRLFLVGGVRPGRAALSDVEAFNLKTGRWEVSPPLGVPRGRLAAVALNGKLYAVGGLAGDGSQVVNSGALEVYDPARRRWRRKADMPTPRHGLAAVAAAGKLLALGGFGPERGGVDGPLSVVEAYDPATDRWTRRAAMPTPRGFLGAAVVQDRVLAVGGLYAPETVERYDPRSDRWERLPALPARLYRFGMTAVGDTVYALGGEETPGLFLRYR